MAPPLRHGTSSSRTGRSWGSNADEGWTRPGPLHSPPRREEGQGCAPLAGRGLAGSLFPIVLPSHALAGQNLKTIWQDGIENPTTGKPIGSGPFLLAGWIRGKQQAFVRNPRYWGLHRRISIASSSASSPEDTADALRRGEIDMIDPSIAVLQAQALELRRRPAPGVRALSGPGNSWEQFAIRVGPGGHPALRNRLVRQALAYGIDRVAIAREAGKLDSRYAAARVPLDSVFFLNSPYYRPNWRAIDTGQIWHAGCSRKRAAEWAPTASMCAGKRLSLRFATAAGVDRRELTVKLAQAQLRRIGVEVVPVFAPRAALFGQVLPSGDFDLALFSWASPSDNITARTSSAVAALVLLHGYCDRLAHQGFRPGDRILDDARARRAPEPNRRDVGERRPRDPALSDRASSP